MRLPIWRPTAALHPGILTVRSRMRWSKLAARGDCPCSSPARWSASEVTVQHFPGSRFSFRNRDHLRLALCPQHFFPGKGGRGAFFEEFLPLRKLMRQIGEVEIFQFTVTFAQR